MLNEKLRKLRVSSSYTQQNVADFLGVERSTYTNYEIGKTEPNTVMLAKLSRLYEVSLDDMIPSTYRGGDGTMILNAPEKELPPLPDFAPSRFAALTREEQQLIMLFRACADREKCIKYLRDNIECDYGTDEE